MGKGGNTANLNKLLNDLKKIEIDCLGESADDKADPNAPKLDAFQSAKRDLSILVKELKESIQRRNDLIDRTGTRDENVIRLRSQNNRNMDKCKKLLVEMRTALEKDRGRTEKKKKNALTDEEINTREELIDLYQKDLDYAEQMSSKKDPGAEHRQRYTVARKAIEARKRDRERKREARGETGEHDSGDEEIEMQPLTREEQLFLDDAQRRDNQIDEKLDEIHRGVKGLGKLADDIHTDIRLQDRMLDKVENKMDDTSAKVESANMRMNRLLDATGGITRWCPYLIAGVIFISLLGYLIKIV